MPKSKFKHLLTKQDFCGPAITLNFNGSSRAQSMVGGVCSVLTKLFLFLLAISKLQELVLAQSARVSTIDSRVDVSNSNFSDMNLGLMLTFKHFDGAQGAPKYLEDPKEIQTYLQL